MSDERQLFLLGQKLFRLKDGFAADQRKAHVCGTGFDEKAWDFAPRNTLRTCINGEEPPYRVALVCEAGLGKSTNMAWLQRHLAERGGRQLALLLRLEDKDDQKLLEEERTPGSANDALVRRLAQKIKDHAEGDPDRIISSIRRLQAAGRITFLIDGLDHVADTEHMASLLKEMLGSLQWRKCPAWISGRPTAFHNVWENVFANSNWEFYRVNELAEREIRLYMTHSAGGDWYDEFREGKNLLAIPRLLHLICGILREAVAGAAAAEAKRAIVRNLKLRTPAEIYWQAFFYIGAHDDANRQGLLAQGLKGDAAKIGGFEPNKDNRMERVERAAAVLGAIAFQMYDMSPDKQNPQPSFEGVLLKPFKKAVADRMVAAGEGTHAEFDRDFNLLKEMNINTLDHLLFREASKERLLFHDRTMQAFFAAYWVCRHAKVEGTTNELAVTRAWLVDDLFEEHQEFGEFWRFAAEMPDDGLPVRLDGSVDETRWLALFTPLYDGSVMDAEERPIRSTEFIHRSWKRMEKNVAGMRLIAEKYCAKSIPRALREGFISLVRNPALAQDTGTFKMGEGGAIREVSVDPYLLHEFCVTNLEFERFDSRHKERRWRKGAKHRAVQELNDDLSADNDCPVVMVSWYDAICYARWLGVFVDAEGNRCEIRLPTEEQWEYACRAGRKMRFTFDGARPTETCTPEYCNYNGDYADDGEEKGEDRKCTLPVDGQIPAWWSAALEITAVKGRNRWGFYQMHGNVWEWCDSRYEGASERVLRGGSWLDFGWSCRSAVRDWSEPDYRGRHLGFRLAAVPAGAKSSKSVGDVAAGVAES